MAETAFGNLGYGDQSPLLVDMLSKAFSPSTLSRLALGKSVAARAPTTKSAKAVPLSRRFAAIKQVRRSYATISVAGGAASTVVEDKLVRFDAFSA